MLSPLEHTCFLTRTWCLPHAIACSLRISETEFRSQHKTIRVKPGKLWFITLRCPLWRIEAGKAFTISSVTEEPTLSPGKSQKVRDADHRNYRQHVTLELNPTRLFETDTHRVHILKLKLIKFGQHYPVVLVSHQKIRPTQTQHTNFRFMVPCISDNNNK
jgi:hypothetical protein